MKIIFNLEREQLKPENIITSSESQRKKEFDFLSDIQENIISIGHDKYIFSMVLSGLDIMYGKMFQHPFLSKVISNKSRLRKKNRDIIDSLLTSGDEGSTVLLQKLMPLINCYKINQAHDRAYYRTRLDMSRTLGGRLFSERKTSDLSIKEIAAVCRISLKEYKQWEDNEAEPTLPALKILNKRYNFDLNYIIGEEDAILGSVICS